MPMQSNWLESANIPGMEYVIYFIFKISLLYLREINTKFLSFITYANLWLIILLLLVVTSLFSPIR